MDNDSIALSLTLGRIANALDRLATNFDYLVASQEAERVAQNQWLVNIARAHLTSSVIADEPIPTDAQN